MARQPKHFVESHHKFLLYIDILGFSEMVRRHPEVIPSIYHIVATANVQEHSDFEAIVFSDTILVYNRDPPQTPMERTFTVMFLCEFCQDLFHRLSAIGVFFRAVIVDGEFQHYNLGQATCFFGTGLIDAYLLEKEIKSVGAFIHSRCLEHGSVYTTVPHAGDIHFLVLTKSFESLAETFDGKSPLNPIVMETVDEPSLRSDLNALKKIHACLNDPDLALEVRKKFATAWGHYKSKLGTTLEFFEQNLFDLRACLPELDWGDTDLDGNPPRFPYPLTPQQYGFLMAFSYTKWMDSYEECLASIVLGILHKERFSGRCEYYHSRATLDDSQIYYVGLGLKDMKGKQRAVGGWWMQFQATVLKELVSRGTPLSEANLSEQASMRGIRHDHTFCGAIKLLDGAPRLVIEHPDRLGTSAFTDVVKRTLLRNTPGGPPP